MSYPKHNAVGLPAVAGRAEASFREAFDRLKRGKPVTLPNGSRVSQNNIAKEAGCDPSALKKSRFPGLVSEIQRWIEAHGSEVPKSSRQKSLARRGRNRDLRAQIAKLKVQRDRVASQLAEADLKILDLTVENTRLNALLPESNVIRLKRRQ